jgi:hypothetical protein
VNSAGYQALDRDGQAGMYALAMFLTGIVFAGRYFSAMASRGAALVLLMRPAAKIEKWLAALLICVVAFPFAYTVVYTLVNLPIAWVARAVANGAFLAGEIPGHTQASLDAAWSTFRPWDMFDEPRMMPELLAMLGTLQGFALLGSLYFRTYPFIKTIVAAFVLLLLLMLVGAFSGGNASLFFEYWDCPCPNRHIASWLHVFLPVAWVAIPALTWGACLAALGEREAA